MAIKFARFGSSRHDARAAGREIRLSFSYISDVERGTRNISLESLGKIISALGVNPLNCLRILKNCRCIMQ
ncbi:helix-turn-helix domain-containing protein [Paenibacillus thailandensis]|uniref:helix-turn-helix domain-containing protein n=1 Tax=Paenibacillus thailandensis TaxID=393250 RepID=UPI0036357353